MPRFGPGLLVTAAFIGPGTVTTASVAGAGFGYALAWTVAFSVAATVVLQEMAARLGLVTGRGLAEGLRTAFPARGSRILLGLLVVGAITFGNAAFETGNVTGAALGLAAVSPLAAGPWAVAVGIGAALLLATGAYRLIEAVLVGLVALMGVVFLVTAWVVGPDWSALWGGLTTPAVPPGGLLTVVALVGTTVVPYNLFLHADAVAEKWRGVPAAAALGNCRWDSGLSIGLGGLLTLAVMATAAEAFFQHSNQVKDAAVMARQLEPLLGAWAEAFFGVGLAAAGLTSAVTAPLAAAYATAGALGWPRDLRDRRLKGVGLVIVASGTLLAAAGTRPVAAIVFAQAANGILLPVVALGLLVVMNRRDLMGTHRNGWLANLLGGTVVLVTGGLGLSQLLRVLGLSP